MRILSRLLQACFLTGIILTVSCTVKVPSHVIQPDKMEELLYDYHLMQAMAGDLKTNERFKRNLYEQYVFDKHKISEAEFDSSLVWYMRNPKELETIYKDLNKRLATQKELLEASVPPGRRTKQMSPAGDSVNIWYDYRLFRLTTTPLDNKLKIDMEPDSNYHANDSFEWIVDALFLQDSTQSQAVMSLTAVYADDTIGNSLPITHSGRYSLTLRGDSVSPIKKMVGFIYHYPLRNEEVKDSLSNDTLNPTATPVLVLSDIKLMKYHHHTDSIRTDSVDVQPTDTTPTPIKEIPQAVPAKTVSTRPTRVQTLSPHADTKEIRIEQVR